MDRGAWWATWLTMRSRRVRHNTSDGARTTGIVIWSVPLAPVLTLAKWGGGRGKANTNGLITEPGSNTAGQKLAESLQRWCKIIRTAERPSAPILLCARRSSKTLHGAPWFTLTAILWGWLHHCSHLTDAETEAQRKTTCQCPQKSGATELGHPATELVFPLDAVSNYHQLGGSRHKFMGLSGGLLVKTSPSSAASAGLIPGWGAGTPQASRPKRPKHKTEAIL